jgi:hypothetical protein
VEERVEAAISAAPNEAAAAPPTPAPPPEPPGPLAAAAARASAELGLTEDDDALLKAVARRIAELQ